MNLAVKPPALDDVLYCCVVGGALGVVVHVERCRLRDGSVEG